MPRWLALLPLLLQACASGPELEAEAARAALASHRASMEALGTGAPRRPAPPSEPRATPGRIAAPLGGTSSPLVPPRTASSLMGASPEAVRAALGEPLLQRREGPAQVWLYASAGCQLDLVLYPSEAGPRVAHVQARAGGLAQRTEASCLRDLSGAAAHSGQGAAGGSGGGAPGGTAGIEPGPVSPGPVSPGPVSTGPVSTGPVSTGPTSAGPASFEIDV